MSHINQAWKVREQAVPRASSSSASRPTARPAEPFPITDYALEGPPDVDAPSRSTAGVVDAPVDAELSARLVTSGTDIVSIEQYRRLAASLHEIQHQQGLKAVVVTSALPREGKTLTTVNLGLTLSTSYGRRVLIVDADLRHPSVHDLLGISNTSGLGEALHGRPLESLEREMSPTLAVLTAGRMGQMPLAGLSSDRMAVLIGECTRRYDWVLLDTPPVGILPDAQLIAELTRAVVFVVAAGVTPAPAITRAVEALGVESIIGTILNRVDASQIPDAGYYSQYGDGAR
jgi:capsular exopolysaccharide synthesis family protein